VVHDRALTVTLVKVMCTTTLVKKSSTLSYCYSSEKFWYAKGYSSEKFGYVELLLL
jgi:hypothetical protein